MPKKVNVTVNINDDQPDAHKYQIYPSEELVKRIDKYRKSFPTNLSLSSALCILLHERLVQIESHDKPIKS